MQKPYCGGWLWKKEKEASVVGIGSKGRIIVEETANLTGDFFIENTYFLTAHICHKRCVIIT